MRTTDNGSLEREREKRELGFVCVFPECTTVLLYDAHTHTEGRIISPRHCAPSLKIPTHTSKKSPPRARALTVTLIRQLLIYRKMLIFSSMRHQPMKLCVRNPYGYGVTERDQSSRIISPPIAESTFKLPAKAPKRGRSKMNLLNQMVSL